MSSGRVVYQFGDFELNPQLGRLQREGTRVSLGRIPLAILIRLVVDAPAVVERQTLVHSAWGGVASDSTLEKAVSRLRDALGDTDGSQFIETVRGGGYRFVAEVRELTPENTPGHPGLERPLHEYETGRRELASLNRKQVEAARRKFLRVIERQPNYAPAHVLLAMACGLLVEALRFHTDDVLGLLREGLAHARRAAELDRQYAEAWSVLGFLLFLNGDTEEACEAARHAVALDPSSWRNAVRLAFVCWGEDRLEAGLLALRARPKMGLALWLRATAFVGRGAFDAALHELADGCIAQDTTPADAPVYPPSGLHLLPGQIFSVLGRGDEAAREFEAELVDAKRGHLYAQQSAPNALYGRGALHLLQGNHSAAEADFCAVLQMAPLHRFAIAALGRPIPPVDRTHPHWFDVVIARAIALARGNRHEEAARLCLDELRKATSPSTGWIILIDPILRPFDRPDIWNPVIALLLERAT